MPNTDDLIRENKFLRARLALAERWMQREVQSSVVNIGRESAQKSTRKYFSNMFEQDGMDIIRRKIQIELGELNHAPKFTLERLIDAEIYWYTLQKYPTMDGLPIMLAYQKILDAWIEERLIAPWRKSCTKSPSIPISVLDRDMHNIMNKHYTLSIGRFYQILSLIRQGNYSGWVANLVQFWQKEVPETFNILLSDTFFIPFSELIQREIFSKKRHEGKVNFSEIKLIKDTIYEIFSQVFN